MAAWKRGCVHVLGVLSLIVYRTMASCDAGKEPGPSPGSCAKCVPGKFKGVAGTEACDSCPINSYSASGRAEDLATATASISAATTSVEGDEISVCHSLLCGRGGEGAQEYVCSRCWCAGACVVANVGQPVHVG